MANRKREVIRIVMMGEEDGRILRKRTGIGRWVREVPELTTYAHSVATEEIAKIYSKISTDLGLGCTIFPLGRDGRWVVETRVVKGADEGKLGQRVDLISDQINGMRNRENPESID